MRLLILLLFCSTLAYAQSPFYNDVVRANTLSPARVSNALDVSKPLASSGTNTYTFPAPFTAYTAYHTGDIFTLVFGNANSSGTVTANIASIGALAIKDASGTDLAIGDLKAGGAYKFYYNGTHLRMIGAASSSGGATAAGATGDIQYKSAGGGLQAEAAFSYDSATNSLHVDGGATATRIKLDADNNVARIFSFRTDDLPRWALRVDGNETGTNVGGDFAIRRYNDAGTLIDAPLSITRSTGASTFAQSVSVPDDAYGAGWDGSAQVPTKNALYDQVELKSNIASPTFTGTPSAPTAVTATNTTQLATTAFVQQEKLLVANRQTASYGLVLSDAFKLVEMNVATANNLTVPLNSTAPFIIGTTITVAQYGAGTTTIIATGGVTIRSSSGLLTSPGQYAPMVLEKIATDEWYLWNGSPANISYGTYTPILTNSANLAASTAYSCTYLRVGNSVTVSGRVDIDPTTTATLTTLGISIPVASTFTTANQAGGSASASSVADGSAAILSDASNARLTLQYICTDVTNHPMYFTVTYQVL